MSVDDQRTPVRGQVDAPDIPDVTRWLVVWVVMRSAVCALFFFAVIVFETNGPFPFGPDYRQATIFTAVATPLAGALLAGRAYLHLQWILAERSGKTLSFWLGRRIRLGLLNRGLPCRD